MRDAIDLLLVAALVVLLVLVVAHCARPSISACAAWDGGGLLAMLSWGAPRECPSFMETLR